MYYVKKKYTEERSKIIKLFLNIENSYGFKLSNIVFRIYRTIQGRQNHNYLATKYFDICLSVKSIISKSYICKTFEFGINNFSDQIIINLYEEYKCFKIWCDLQYNIPEIGKIETNQRPYNEYTKLLLEKNNPYENANLNTEKHSIIFNILKNILYSEKYILITKYFPELTFLFRTENIKKNRNGMIKKAILNVIKFFQLILLKYDIF